MPVFQQLGQARFLGSTGMRGGMLVADVRFSTSVAGVVPKTKLFAGVSPTESTTTAVDNTTTAVDNTCGRVSLKQRTRVTVGMHVWRSPGGTRGTGCRGQNVNERVVVCWAPLCDVEEWGTRWLEGPLVQQLCCRSGCKWVL